MPKKETRGCVHLQIRRGQLTNVFSHLSAFPDNCVVHLKPDKVFSYREFKKTHLMDHDELTAKAKRRIYDLGDAPYGKVEPSEVFGLLHKMGFKAKFVPDKIIGKHLACYNVNYKGKLVRPLAALELKIPLNQIWIAKKLRKRQAVVIWHELREIYYVSKGQTFKQAHA